MKKIILFLFLIYCGITYAQNETVSPKTIYLLGGFASTINETDLIFAKQFNITYYEFGCVVPPNIKKYEELNWKVFDALNVNFGNNWQSEMKTNAMGFDTWKRNQRNQKK